MRHLFFLLLMSLYFIGQSWSQTGKTYAVIVGISAYESDGITRLDFAHRDAEEFDRFLRSKSGGNVPDDNIRLLLNENATYASIYNALYWLLETCNKNDLVYFYFSGHGDVENNTIYKLGFLLATNSPRSNYIHNAVRIEDLNNIANTLSVEKGAKVVLITDACHSGKLAGSDNRGNFLVGEQLRTIKGNEIRITSCGPDELSNEDERWGGGRGVFSYYLVKGLEGLADYSKDQAVTLDELKNYLQTSLKADRVLAVKEHKQTPVINGRSDIRLAVVDPARLMVIQQQVSPSPVAGEVETSLKPLGISPQGYLFSLIGNNNIEELVDFNFLFKLPAEQVPFSFISLLLQSVASKVFEPDAEKIQRLENSLKENKAALRRFNEKLVELMADRGQQVINLYLDGDEAELERRRYYNSRSSGYDVYPKMFATALKLLSPQNPLFPILKVKLHYFSGVAARLKIPLLANYTGLLDTAFREQRAALQLEDAAAYIHNELGILFRLKKDNINAEKHFLRAVQIAPAWAMPLSNLGGLYVSTSKHEKATEALDKARQLQPGFQGNYINTGLLQEKKGNLLLAEENYQKSIRINTRHYLPFERLGFVYMNTTMYAEADSNFHEADIRKRGYHFPPPNILAFNLDESFIVAPPIPPCDIDTSLVSKRDVIGNFFIAQLYILAGRADKAEWKLKQIIQWDTASPLAFHYLGKILYEQKRWQEADIILNYALRNHLGKEDFRSYCDSLLRIFPQYDVLFDRPGMRKMPSCVFDRFRFAWINRNEVRYFLGTAYEKWNHPEEAEKQFRDIIRDDSSDIGAYYKLWNLLETRGRYYDAEAVIRSFPVEEIVYREMFAFYRRVIQRHPERGEWYYKAGAMMYDRVASEPGNYPGDRKYIQQDTNEELYVANSFYKEQQMEDPKSLPTRESFSLHSGITFPVTEGIRYLKKADSLISNDEWLAEINFKTGDLYMWQGLPQRAEPFYRKSVYLAPDDANTRSKYANVNAVNYHLSIAMEQLDSLHSRKEINFSNQVRLARYCIHAGRFADAGKLLRDAKSIHPYIIPEITDLNGRLNLLSGKPLLAIPFYKEYQALYPDDVNCMYSLARLYARSGNTREAWKWLEQAIKKGFNYYWVLKFDDSWNILRASSRWNELTGRIKPKS